MNKQKYCKEIIFILLIIISFVCMSVIIISLIVSKNDCLWSNYGAFMEWLRNINIAGHGHSEFVGMSRAFRAIWNMDFDLALSFNKNSIYLFIILLVISTVNLIIAIAVIAKRRKGCL